MASVENPCYLVARGAVRSSVYACIPVDASLARRSAVMTSLMQSSGMKELPEGLSLDSLQTWCTMPKCVQDETPEDLACVLQAGEMLDDQDEEARETQARALAQRIADTSEQRHHSLAAFSQSILTRLSKQSKELVFQELHSLDSRLWTQLPLPLQHEYLNVCVSAAPSSLTLPPTRSSTTAAPPQDTLALLSRTTPSSESAGLQTLQVAADIGTPVDAALLSQALLHHTTLSALAVPSLSCHASSTTVSPATTIYRALPHLTLLTSLSISIPLHQAEQGDPVAAAAAVHTLADAVSALPALAAVALVKDRGAQARRTAGHTEAPAPKLRRLGGRIGRRVSASLDPVIAALATAPALTSLSLPQEPQKSAHLPVSGANGSFAALRYLHIDLCEPSADEAADPPPRDPLPALQVLSIGYDGARPDSPQANLLQAMIAAAAAQPALRRVAVHGPGAADGSRRGDLSFDAARRAELLSAVELPRPLHVRFELTWYSIASLREPVSRLTSVPSLHSLSIRFAAAEVKTGGAARRGPGAHAEPPHLEPLTALQQLRDLEVQSTNAAAHACLTEALAAAPLTALTQLSALALRVPDAAARLVTHLSALTALQRLCVHALPADGGAALAPLTRLTRLTHLELAGRAAEGDGAGVVRAFAACAARLPQLRSARLLCWDSLGKQWSTWVEGLRELPRRGTYEFEVSRPAAQVSGREAVRQELIARGAHLSEDCSTVVFGESCMGEE